MKLKLTNSEATALLSLLQSRIEVYNNVILAMRESRKAKVLLDAAEEDEAPEMYPMMHKAIYEEWHRKLAKQMFDKQDKYSFELKPQWAFMFHIDFAGLCQPTQEGNLAREICSKVHQEYSSPKYLNYEPNTNA